MWSWFDCFLTNGKKSRKVVEYGIEALKAVWHRGAVDADGKSGDGAGIKVEISPDFFNEKITETGHSHDSDKRICVGMVFMPRNDYGAQEKCRSIIETVLLNNNYLYLWLAASACESKSFRLNSRSK